MTPPRTAVTDYYERNTRWFLRVGGDAGVGTIHRGLWPPGVTHASAAMDEAHVQVRDRCPRPTPRIVDLGCGVGGSLCRVVGDDGTGVGLTLSPTQVSLAQARAADDGLADRVSFVCADFTDPPDLGTFDLAFAIEAFVHGPDPAAFFASAARLIGPGGRLVVIDDVRAESPPPEAGRHLAAFEEGWRLSSLVTAAEMDQAALGAGLGLVEDVDLTPWIRLWRWRDRAVALWVHTLGRLPSVHPYWASLSGGHALQICLSRGFVTYRLRTYAALEGP